MTPAQPTLTYPTKAGPTPIVLHHTRHCLYLHWQPASYLTRCRSSRVPFDWTLNPYRGCWYGCHYCYARYTHEFLELDPVDGFESTIFVKAIVQPALERELRKVHRGQWLAIGTATDPYQPIERRLRVTRAVLACMVRLQGMRISLATKSDLVLRDLDLLQELRRRNRLMVHVTLTTVDPTLAREWEPRAPSPERRLKTVEQLTRADIGTGVLCHPVMPGLNDHPEAIWAVAHAAAEAGARFFSVGPLFLMPAARQAFFAYLRQKRPALVPTYERLFAAGPYLGRSYMARVEAAAAEARRRFGLLAGEPVVDPGEPVQLELPFGSPEDHGFVKKSTCPCGEARVR